MKPFITIISFFITTLCFSQVTTTVQTVIVDSGKYEFKLQVKKDTSDYSKAYRILTNQVKLNPNNDKAKELIKQMTDNFSKNKLPFTSEEVEKYFADFYLQIDKNYR